MRKADVSTKRTIADLLINRVKLYPERAIVEGIIPLDNYALVPSKHASPTLRITDPRSCRKKRAGVRTVHARR